MIPALAVLRERCKNTVGAIFFSVCRQKRRDAVHYLNAEEQAAMKTNRHGIRWVIVLLGLACLAEVVWLKGDLTRISHMTFHELETNAPLILVLGFGLSYLAYCLLSSKKKPTAATSLVGLLCLLVGSLLLV